MTLRERIEWEFRHNGDCKMIADRVCAAVSEARREAFEETRSVSSESVWFELHLSPSQLERMLTAMQRGVRSLRVTKEKP